MRTRPAPALALLASAALATLTLVGCTSGGTLTAAETDASGARSTNLDQNNATIALDTWTITTAGPINVGSMALDRGIESLGESPETRTHLRLGEAELLYANDQDSVLEGVEIALATGDVIHIDRWASTGSTVVSELADRYRAYVERALSLDAAALEGYLAYVEQVEGPAVRGLVESFQALGTQGLSILPDLLRGLDPPEIDLPETPADPNGLPPAPAPSGE